MTQPTAQELRAAAKVLRWIASEATGIRNSYPMGFRWMYDMCKLTPDKILQQSALLDSMADDAKE